MGPRLISRGNELSRVTPPPAVPGFNGAATDQSRKITEGEGNEVPPVRFNGAATDQSRKCSASGAQFQWDNPLQWGRD